MSYDGAGNFTPLSPQYPAVSGEVIFADDWNDIVLDLANGLTLALTRDGQSSPTANINWGGFKITNLNPGVALGQAVEYDQVFNAPAFTAPTAVASPADANDSLLLATTAWVQDRIVEPIYKALAVPAADNSRLLATTEFVRSIAYGPYYSSAAAVFNYRNY